MTQQLPCVDCGAVVPVNLRRGVTTDKILVPCDLCIGVRVAAVLAERREGVLPLDPSTTHHERIWHGMLSTRRLSLPSTDAALSCPA